MQVSVCRSPGKGNSAAGTAGAEALVSNGAAVPDSALAATGADDASAAGPAAAAELSSGLVDLFKNVRLLDFTTRKLEMRVAASALDQGGGEFPG